LEKKKRTKKKEKKEEKKIVEWEPEEGVVNSGMNSDDKKGGKIERDAKIILGIFAVLLVGFILFAVLSEKDIYTYESSTGEVFQFQKINLGETVLHQLSVFVTENGQEHQYLFPMRYSPKEVEGIYLQKGVVDKVYWYGQNGGWIFFTLDPYGHNKLTIARDQVSTVVGTADYSLFGIPSYGAFTSDVQNETNMTYPYKTCKDAYGKQGVIWFKLGEETKVYYDNCIIVEGKDYDELIKASDRLAYGLLKVI
jgi:hypothetical protein